MVTLRQLASFGSPVYSPEILRNYYFSISTLHKNQFTTVHCTIFCQNIVDTIVSARSFYDYVIHFRIAKGGKGWMLCSRSMNVLDSKSARCLWAAVCMGVPKEHWREVVCVFIDSPRTQNCGGCGRRLLNVGTGRLQLIVGSAGVILLLVSSYSWYVYS